MLETEFRKRQVVRTSDAAIVIPARYASTRLPGKPLLKETGKYLIEHVYERAAQCRRAGRVIVATDDERIFRAVQSFGGEATMTRADHASGTDRVAEVARGLSESMIVNVQGDEPEVSSEALERLIELLVEDAPKANGHRTTETQRHAANGRVMATLATPFRTEEDWRDPAAVKVVVDAAGRAMYFSRSPIPFVRDGQPDLSSGRFLLHLGIYAYRREFLLKLAQMPPSPLERLEKLEQLRVLEAGHPIQVGLIDEPSMGVDTEEDYRAFVDRWHGKVQELGAGA